MDLDEEKELSPPDKIVKDCYFCRITGTILFTGLGAYAISCSRRFTKPSDRIFSYLISSALFSLATYRAITPVKEYEE
ncbi:conserved Plasmodium protein, unknown function [Babesia microti strain RI]|uniref:Distal membrane-arm assembly complex protein 1-like domain-containing protein n=1 Tax=Babesia microti (strain RI) TaxID=1133968 RepID=A0A1N6LXL9_BABMR|nr:conserved Plasmodium protein, unknown function [Babesia microti strain RI]SIO73614.1 conserved Plasmodium protein, unknown function [Babesia microti strain RI]|eukprot:XP_021337698.1 conserved Plasmodium protein, unknown function [Babesia microti strain RI]